MKWLASLGATPGDCACTVMANTAAAPAKITKDFAVRMSDDMTTVYQSPLGPVLG
jgi:hypothetical protein